MPSTNETTSSDKLLAFVANQYAEVAHNIRTAKAISNEDEKRLHEACKAFKAKFKA